MSERVFIALGSNCNAEESIKRALLLLQERLDILGASTFYRSKAVGACREGADFINGVIELKCEYSPYDLKYKLLRPIEAVLGRKRAPDSSKTKIIDLDLLLYGDFEISAKELTLPDPDIARFPFISIPLLELAPTLILPGTSQTLSSSIDIEKEKAALKPLEEFSRQVRALLTRLVTEK